MEHDERILLAGEPASRVGRDLDRAARAGRDSRTS